MFKTYTGSLPDLKTIQIQASQKGLQRTEEWFEQRRGRFTGSKIKDLMSCSRSTAKLEWGRAEKLIDFGNTAKKYIYGRAKERQRNKVVKIPSSAAMKYGTENEIPVVKLLKKQYPDYIFEDVGFVEFIEGIAGASPDGRIITPAKKIGLEIKCATDWNGVYDRHELPIDQTNKDFWQLQGEMLALEVNEIMYVTAEPSENIFEPNITDLSIKFIDASPIHQKAIEQRCMIADAGIELYLNGLNFHEAIQKACSDFEIETY